MLLPTLGSQSHLSFLLGVHLHRELSDLISTLHLEGQHSVLSGCGLRDGASGHCAEKSISVFCDTHCLCVQSVISSSASMTMGSFPYLVHCEVEPWSLVMLGGIPCVWIGQSLGPSGAKSTRMKRMEIILSI